MFRCKMAVGLSFFFSVMACAPDASVEDGASGPREYVFSNGEVLRYAVDGEYVIRDGDVIVGKVEDLQAFIAEYEMSLKRAPGSVRSQGYARTVWRECLEAGEQPRTCAVWGETSYLWPNSTVPYEIDTTGMAQSEINAIQNAVNVWNGYMDLKWVYNSSSRNRVRFVKREMDFSGGLSSVGMVGGVQDITINASFIQQTLLHEMGHAAGLEHEHQRCDRDNYVTIVMGNVDSRRAGNFDKRCNKTNYRNGGDVWSVVTPYDYYSIMHYRGDSFSSGGLTIVTKDISFQNIIGTSNIVSIGDINTINTLY